MAAEDKHLNLIFKRSCSRINKRTVENIQGQNEDYDEEFSR